MKNDLQIIPAILAFEKSEYQKKVDIINNAPEFTDGMVQVDITDGEFTQNKSVGLDTIAKYPLNLKVEAHLMVSKPLDWIDSLVKLGVKRIIVPLESKEVSEAINKIRSFGIEVGLGINPETSIARIMPFIDQINVLLILSVHPGEGGQELIPATLERIKQISKQRKEYGFKIEVDGGITTENIKAVTETGVDGIVIGERLIYGDIAENLENIWEELHS